MNRKILLYNEDLDLINILDLPPEIHEGWGIAKYTDENNFNFFLVTEGSEKIFKLDIDTLNIIETIKVFKYD